MRMACFPLKTETPLLIASDAVLPLAITHERFQVISWKIFEEFRQSKEFIAFTEKDKGYQKMAQQMDKYWDKLFIDPIEVKTPHGKQWIQPQTRQGGEMR